jgi:hypothetical protein
MLAPPLRAGVLGRITRCRARDLVAVWLFADCAGGVRGRPRAVPCYQRNALVRRGGRAGRPYKALPNQRSSCTVTVRLSGLMVMRNRFVIV